MKAFFFLLRHDESLEMGEKGKSKVFQLQFTIARHSEKRKFRTRINEANHGPLQTFSRLAGFSGIISHYPSVYWAG